MKASILLVLDKVLPTLAMDAADHLWPTVSEIDHHTTTIRMSSEKEKLAIDTYRCWIHI